MLYSQHFKEETWLDFISLAYLQVTYFFIYFGHYNKNISSVLVEMFTVSRCPNGIYDIYPPIYTVYANIHMQIQAQAINF